MSLVIRGTYSSGTLASGAIKGATYEQSVGFPPAGSQSQCAMVCFKVLQ